MPLLPPAMRPYLSILTSNQVDVDHITVAVTEGSGGALLLEAMYGFRASGSADGKPIALKVAGGALDLLRCRGRGVDFSMPFARAPAGATLLVVTPRRGESWESVQLTLEFAWAQASSRRTRNPPQCVSIPDLLPTLFNPPPAATTTRQPRIRIMSMPEIRLSLGGIVAVSYYTGSTGERDLIQAVVVRTDGVDAADADFIARLALTDHPVAKTRSPRLRCRASPVSVEQTANHCPPCRSIWHSSLLRGTEIAEERREKP